MLDQYDTLILKFSPQIARRKVWKLDHSTSVLSRSEPFLVTHEPCTLHRELICFVLCVQGTFSLYKSLCQHEIPFHSECTIHIRNPICCLKMCCFYFLAKYFIVGCILFLLFLPCKIITLWLWSVPFCSGIGAMNFNFWVLSLMTI